MSLFANLGKPAGGTSIFGNTTANSNPFGQTTTNQQQQQQQQQPAPSTSIFGQTNANAQQQLQQPAPSTSIFGQTNANAQQQLQQQASQPGQTMGQSQQGNSNAIWQEGQEMGNHHKSVIDKVQSVANRWEPSHPDTDFKYYFYNKVDEANVPFYQPGPNENAREWEEALQKKPAAGFMPVLAVGFAAIAERLTAQRNAVGTYNARLHEINNCLDLILGKHDLDWTVRAVNARRRHEAQRKRSMALARKVQVLRNRGYALSGDEDDLRLKIEKMEKSVQDPAVNSRLEELWSRLIMLRNYSQTLHTEIAKRGLGEVEVLCEEVEAKAKKIIEDYEKQLQHLKKEVELIQKDLEEWQKDHSLTK